MAGYKGARDAAIIERCSGGIVADGNSQTQ
jgi:hypothetical protein